MLLNSHLPNDSIMLFPSGLSTILPIASPSSETLPNVPFSMKMNCPPPQVMRVGFEPNQQGQAALHEHASSSWPTIFHGVAAARALRASAAGAINATPPRATSARDRATVLAVLRALPGVRG